MPNSYFQFKQFIINQDRCAMKVCTDACLFGAWVADKLAHVDSIQNILDIGTGTGLLSLMLAQKVEANIDAIELNKEAARQAEENFTASPWKDRLQVYLADINEFDPPKKYDCIISNPPFFQDDLKSENASKNAAKHDTTLTLDKLVMQMKRLLSEDGLGAILIPFHRAEYLRELLKKNDFYIREIMDVKQTVTHGFFRTMLIFSRKPAALIAEQLHIHDAQRQYTEAFSSLLKDYYLKL